MYGLVSTLVILKGCSPVIPQLHAKQLLYNITDDDAGGQKLDFYKYYSLDIGLWNLEESAIVPEFTRSLSLFPTYAQVLQKLHWKVGFHKETWGTNNSNCLNIALVNSHSLNIGDFQFWMKTLPSTKVCNFQVMHSEIVLLILSRNVTPKFLMLYNYQKHLSLWSNFTLQQNMWIIDFSSVYVNTFWSRAKRFVLLWRTPMASDSSIMFMAG